MTACDEWRNISTRVSPWHDRGRERDVSYQIHRPAPVCPRFSADPVDSGLCSSDSHPSRIGEQKCLLKNERPTWCPLLFFFNFISYVLNMFRTLIYPSSGVCDCVEHIRNERKKKASDIKLVFHSSTITMMHGPINIRFRNVCVLSEIQILTIRSSSSPARTLVTVLTKRSYSIVLICFVSIVRQSMGYFKC